MKDKILANIVQKTGIPEIVEILSERLSGSELNSLLLEVFSRKIKKTNPSQLLRQYQANRLVRPSDLDRGRIADQELRALRYMQSHDFQPLELSPVAQLGTCSVVATANQDKIISATRNTEIVADASNVLALHIADIRKTGMASGQGSRDLLRFCTVHRHIRTQEIKVKGFTPHFKVGCLVTAGMDCGSFQFECRSLQELFKVLQGLFREVFAITKIRFILQDRGGYPGGNRVGERVYAFLQKECVDIEISRESSPAENNFQKENSSAKENKSLKENNYYRGIQFKMVIETGGREWEIADGGFVNWTQQLLGNKKERLLIAGFGLDFMVRLQSGLS